MTIVPLEPDGGDGGTGGAGRRVETGAAVVDFVLVMLVLIPLFLGIMQVGLFMHVRNTMTACASEGARYGANYNRTPAAGAQRAAACISDALSARFAGNVTGGIGTADGQPMVVITARSQMPPIGMWGPDVLSFTITGHAVKEPAP